MATLLKARVAGTDFAPPITSAAGLAAAAWVEQPLTYRDDEVSVVEGDPTEEEVFSHENDAPEDYDITGAGISIIGSFIKVTLDELAEILGGAVSGASPNGVYTHSAKKVLINKAVRFRLKTGGAIVIPNAKGYVQFNANIGQAGVIKFPFKFKALAGSSTWDADLIIQETVPASGG